MIRDLELIIFDMDGLMFDSETISYKSWNEAFNEYGYKLSEDVFKKTLGATREKTKDVFISSYGVRFPFEDIIDLRNSISRRIVEKEGIPTKNGLQELLDFLCETNLKIAVATSASSNRARVFLEKSKVIDYFDYILCGDEVESSKPNPEIFIKTCDHLSCNPKKTIVLEDSEAGIEAAFNAGMCPIMIPDLIEPGMRTKSMIYRQYNDLSDVIELLRGQ